MSFELKGETVIGAHDPAELKLVFRALHGALADHPDLMDTHFLAELQRYLQVAATQAGVDIADHSQWDRWLGNHAAPACEQRLANRRTIG